MRVLGLDHVQLAMPTGSEGRARGFYGDVLGMKEIPKPEAPGRTRRLLVPRELHRYTSASRRIFGRPRRRIRRWSSKEWTKFSQSASGLEYWQSPMLRLTATEACMSWILSRIAWSLSKQGAAEIRTEFFFSWGE